MSLIRVRYLDITLPIIFALVSASILTGLVTYLIAAVIPGVFLFISYISSKPDETDLRIERSITDKTPSPGEAVEIKLEVVNKGNSVFTDLRVVDGVPKSLKVIQGSPRSSMVLFPGSKKTISYEVKARKGEHSFDSVTVGYSNGRYSFRSKVKALKDDFIECEAPVGDLEIRNNSLNTVGDILTDKDGNGIEFHSLRNYHSNDPISRVEWKHLAKRHDLATKVFREERDKDILLVVDFREVSRRRAEAGEPLATDLCLYATERVYQSVVDLNQRVGIIILGLDSDEVNVPLDSSSACYISPGRSRKNYFKIEKLLKEAQDCPSLDEADIDAKIYRHINPDSQTVILSPLLDDRFLPVLKSLEAQNHSPTVISPNVTYSSNMPSRLHKIQREITIKKIRKFSPVLDWNIDKPLSLQLSKKVEAGYRGKN